MLYDGFPELAQDDYLYGEEDDSLEADGLPLAYAGYAQPMALQQ